MSEDDIKERDEFRRKLNQLWLCVLGNGHPEEGLAWKVNELALFTNTVKKLIWIGATGAVSAILLLLYTVLKDQIQRGNL